MRQPSVTGGVQDLGLGGSIIFVPPTKWSGIWILIKDMAAGHVI